MKWGVWRQVIRLFIVSCQRILGEAPLVAGEALALLTDPLDGRIRVKVRFIRPHSPELTEGL